MNGMVTIVTGGAQGIGRTIANFLAEKGSDIAIFDIMDGTEACAEISAQGRKCRFYQVNVVDTQMVKDAVDQVVKDFGKLDNLVNNAGITRDNLLLRIKEEDWDAVLDVNLKSVFNCTKAVVKHMLRTGGSIVNISSVVGVMGNAGPGQLLGKQGRYDRLYEKHGKGIRGKEYTGQRGCPRIYQYKNDRRA